MNARPAAKLDRDVRFEVYRHLVDTAAAPTVDDLAAGLGASKEAISTALHRLGEAHELVLAPDSDEVWMAHPFSAVPTPYPVETPHRRYWANCAWDALAIPSLLGVDAETVTSCPGCGDSLVLRVRDDDLEPTDTVVHFLVPPRDFWEDIGFT